MPSTSSAFILAVLKSMRDAIREKRYTFEPRKKNMDTLARLGITIKQALDEMLSLTEQDYVSGPENDRDRPGEDPLWIFKKRCYGEVIYIKFRVKYNTDGSIKILSFHIDEK